MRILYTVLFYCLTPLIMLRMLWRSRRAPGYRARWSERFGIVPFLQGPAPIWIHAVSVGESVAAASLIKVLRQRYPALPIVVTTTTPTGSERVLHIFGDQVWHYYAPYDLPDAISRFFKRIKPRLLVLMETELWPNLLAACDRQGVPVVIANARLSARSAKGYQRVSRVTQQMLASITAIAAQSADDAARFIKLGMPESQVQTTGSIKFDIESPASIVEQADVLRSMWGRDRLIWIAGSTHEGEEEQMLKAHKRLKKLLPNCLLVLVPRHPERFNRVAQLIKKENLTGVLRSENTPCTADVDVFLGDTMGELELFYAASDVAFVGGSLVPVGGHNVLEPIALGVPTLSGQHIFNFKEITDLLLKAKALQLVPDRKKLVEALGDLLGDSAKRANVSERGLAVIHANRGAVAKHVALISTFLSASTA